MIIRYLVAALCWFSVTFAARVDAFELAPRRDLSIADIPACGIQCLFIHIPKSGCRLDDIGCICSQHDLIAAASSCMVQNCTMADNLATARVNKQLCDLSDESKSATIITYTAIVYVFAFTCVALRVAGKLVSTGLAWNDVPVLVAVLLAAVPIGLVLAMTKLGFGEHLWNLEDDRLLPILRYFYISRSLYIIILGLIKISLVLFYLEIFTTRKFRRISWLVFAYIVLHSVTIFILTIFACTPIQAFWNRDLLLGNGKCMDIQIVSYTNSVSSVLQDLTLMFLPIFFIKDLHMKRHRKLALVTMFSLGGFGCITTFIRLHTLLKFKITFDPTWDYASIVIWTELEITACFLCVSLPSIRVLVMKLIPRISPKRRPNATSLSNNDNNNNKDSKAGRLQHGMAQPPGQWNKAVTWTTITSNEDTDIAKPKKSLSINSRTPIIPHSQFSHNQHNVTRKGKSAKSNYSESKVATTRPPFRDIGSVAVPESRFSVKQAMKCSHRQSRNSRGGYNGTEITALPSIGCLPERTYSNEILDRDK